MKVHLLLLVCAVTNAIAGGVERSCDELKARLSSDLLDLQRDSPTGLLPSALSVRSCDLDDDGALNSLEFADCLQRMTDDQSERSADTHQQRADCFQSFMKEADEDLDEVVSSAELGRWSARLDWSPSLRSENSSLSSSTEQPEKMTFNICHDGNCFECSQKDKCSVDGECSGGRYICINETCCYNEFLRCYEDVECVH